MKLNGTYSSRSEIIHGVPQGSILGPLAFDIILCNLIHFFPDLDIAIYADDSTPNSTNVNIIKILYHLEKSHTYEEGGAQLRISFWHLLMNFEKPKKLELWKNEKKLLEISSSTHVYQKPQ